MKKILLGLVLASAGFVGFTGAAHAAPVYAQSVVEATAVPMTDDGDTVASIDPSRTDPNAVIGPADGVFYSLGFGGYLVLDFGSGLVTSPGAVTEVTFRLEGYLEKMQVFVSKTLDFLEPAVATISNQVAGLPGGTSFSFTTDGFRYVKLVDISPSGSGPRDGFDIDSISFTPVPVPAAGLLLGGALAGLGALRRRSKKA